MECNRCNIIEAVYAISYLHTCLGFFILIRSFFLVLFRLKISCAPLGRERRYLLQNNLKLYTFLLSYSVPERTVNAERCVAYFSGKSSFALKKLLGSHHKKKRTRFFILKLQLRSLNSSSKTTSASIKKSIQLRIFVFQGSKQMRAHWAEHLE